MIRNMENSSNGSTQTTCDDFGWHWNNPYFRMIIAILEDHKISKNTPAPLCGLGVNCT